MSLRQPLSDGGPALWARQSVAGRSAARLMVVSAVLLSTMLWAQPARADRWYEHYARAQAAIDDGRWNDAVKQLNEALERKGDSGANERTYGMKVIGYFPYLQLGIAYFHLEQYDAALEAFQTEERLGAIQASPADVATLRSYRTRAESARAEAAEAIRRRIEEIVRQGVAEAERLRTQGRLPEAVVALDRALAVDPENTVLQDRMSRLRGEVAQLELTRRDHERAARLAADGKARLASGELAEAASLFSRALALRPDAEVQGLLDEAQRGLRQRIEPDPAATDRSLVAAAVSEARRMADEGRIGEALDRLQPGLAVRPDDVEAVSLFKRLLGEQRQAEDRDAVAHELATAQTKLQAGDHEGAVAAANRALALDSGNAAALDLVRQAYAGISRRLLGVSGAENLPPAIRFADFRRVDADGVRLQVVRESQFRLTGVVIDSSPVTVELTCSDGSSAEATVRRQNLGATVITEFAVEEILQHGLTTFRLAATDDEGLSSSSEYAVVYVRPVYLAPWFGPLLVAIPFAVVVGVMLVRARRRHRLLRRRFNPYIAGAPVLDERLFMGREGLIERVMETIHTNSLLLYGERRIGKTSVQHHLRRRLREVEDREYAFFPAYIDLQGTAENRFFATLAEGVFEELAEELGDLQPEVDVRSGEYGYRELVGDLRRVVQRLGEGTGKLVKIVLLLDEVDELNGYDPRVNQKLRSLFMKSFAEHLVAVVSGVGIRKAWEREGSPWYNFFEEIEVEPLREAAAEELVLRPIHGVFEVGNGVVERVLEVTERKPYRIQRVCLALVNRMHEEGRRTITVADVEAVVTRGTV